MIFHTVDVLISSPVILNEAKHLSFVRGALDLINQRFFASLRMTRQVGFWNTRGSLHYSSHFFGSFCLSASTGSNRSPCFSTRASVWSERNFKSSAFFFFKQVSTSFQVTGVETVGSSFARNE